jgi:hypothetical protein
MSPFPLMAAGLNRTNQHRQVLSSSSSSLALSHMPLQSSPRPRVRPASAAVKRQAREERAPSIGLRKDCELRNITQEVSQKVWPTSPFRRQSQRELMYASITVLEIKQAVKGAY